MNGILAALGDGTLSTAVARRAATAPFVDELRQGIATTDAEWLLMCAQDPDPAKGGLAIGLLRPIQEEPGVRDGLDGIWADPPTFEHAWWVMVPLLDYDDLPLTRRLGPLNFVATECD